MNWTRKGSRKADNTNRVSLAWASIQSLSVEELILGGRLATRVGGSRLSRRLFRGTYDRNPDNPRVRYFTNHARRHRWRLLDRLREFEANPDICAEDTEMQASLQKLPSIWSELECYTVDVPLHIPPR